MLATGGPALWPRSGFQSIFGVFMSLAAHADLVKLAVVLWMGSSLHALMLLHAYLYTEEVHTWVHIW